MPGTPNSMRALNSSMMSMPTIEEKEGECDIREEIERKEKEYLKKVNLLEHDLDVMKKTKDVQ